jgi:hypothetical protein
MLATPPRLSNLRTDWEFFRHLITERLTLNITFKATEDIEKAVKIYDNLSVSRNLVTSGRNVAYSSLPCQSTHC